MLSLTGNVAKDRGKYLYLREIKIITLQNVVVIMRYAFLLRGENLKNAEKAQQLYSDERPPVDYCLTNVNSIYLGLISVCRRANCMFYLSDSDKLEGINEPYPYRREATASINTSLQKTGSKERTGHISSLQS